MISVTRSLDGRAHVAAGPMSVRLHNLLAFAGLSLLVPGLAGLSISLGAIDLTFWDAIRILLGGEATEDQLFAVVQVRLPRILLGFMAGFSVALTGAMLQSLAQNPLADPGLLGLSQGSLIMIMLFIVFFPGIDKAYYPFGALIGGLGIAALLMLLVGRENTGGIAILLMGIAVETTLSSITAMLLIHTPPEVSFELGIWLNGSLFFSNWPNLREYAVWFALTIPAILLVGKSLKAMDLGDQIAMSIGEPAHLTKPIILIIAVLITSASVSQVGPLVFLGVLAPHLAGFISPATGKSRLILSGMMGGALVIGADIITRTLTTSAYLPIGLTIIMVGAPLFIITLRLSSLRQARH